MSKLKNIKGQKFGKLLVIQYLFSDKRGKAVWQCQCDCGNIKNCIGSALIGSKLKSCGCGQFDGGHKTHGKSYTKTYTCWQSMKGRCLNKNAKEYKHYGGRGITICDRWLNSFENFLEDMGECPENLSLDRIDVNGNYCKENCRWATTKTQQNNRRNNNYIEFEGETQSLAFWAEKYKINYNTLYNRVFIKKMPFKKAISLPVRQKYDALEYNGEIKTIKDWALLFNIDYTTLWYRITKSKLSITEAIKKG